MKQHVARRIAPLAFFAGAAISPSAFADVSPNAGMMRWPDVSKDHISFVYANDIWIAPKAGGQARPLASPPGVESFPRFNADGSAIAFIGNYDGNRDIYSIPAGGGISARITHNPAGETLCDWTPSGGLIFFTNGFSGLPRQQQLWQTTATGGLPTQLPVPYGGFGSISPDGNWLAYTPHSVDTRTWKRYRGGMATDIWLFNLNDKTSQRITDWEGVDTLPMWVPGGDGKTVYYHADKGREHRMNIWAYDIATKATRQITTFADDDIKWPSIGPGSDGKGEIVFQLGSKLMLLNLGTGQSSEVNITIPGDRPKLRPRTVDASKMVEGASISPSGKRVAMEGRGDLWSAPVKEGVVRAITRTDDIAERDPAWSPDGKFLAYFSDQSESGVGDYNLWVRASDARPPEKKNDKKDDKKQGKKDDKQGEEQDEKKSDNQEAKPIEAAAPSSEADKVEAPKRETRKLSDLGPGYRYSPRWSPDSKFITFVDQNGGIFLTDVEKGETKQFDADSWMNQPAISWSSDSQWIAYARAEEKTGNGVIVIANVKTGDKQVVTDHMFPSSSPAFDRKGEWLFFASQRAVNNPEYSDIDNTYAYRESQFLLMVPLNKDVKNPWLPKSDEEEYKVDAKKEDKKDKAKEDDAKKDEAKKEEGDKKPVAPSEDPVSGTWSGTAKGGQIPGGSMPVTLNLTLSGDKLTGTIVSAMGEIVVSGSFDKATGKFDLTGSMQGQAVSFSGTISGQDLTGTWIAGEQQGDLTATKAAAGGADDKNDDKTDDKKDAEKPNEVKIDFDGFERRAIQLPIPAGSFGALAVADGEKLIFRRNSARGDTNMSGIRVYNYAGDEKKEEAVTTGGNFDLSADGKKLLVFRGGSSMVVVDPSSGGGKSQTLSTSGMSKVMQDPRAEWKHIVNEAWRLQRDFFYEPSMHGIDWPKVRDHYLAMVDDASSREDVNWIISEMISELNIGHAYLGAPGDVEDQPTSNVGLLGVDFTLDRSGAAPAYKIARIIEGGPWDSDARGPLSQPGVDAKAGDYILAVNGVPIDTGKDPYAAFVGTADRITSITLSDKSALDADGAKQRELVIKPLGSESNLRYRDWIEQKRAHVHEKSKGKVGYIYVPNTGVDGQNDLYRQFFGQRDRDALIIDDRWNGGGQIPNRFIELLNRPNTNFWAKRAGQDWVWPPDAHFGPKAMLINGLAGSGGDMFPWLFRFHKLGPLIGTRTWGGLVGISGNPRMVDGGYITVPTFGFYETDGTWGVEGHGVDPDIEVIDDPAQMQNGNDPQLDRALAEMLKAVQERPWKRPQRPQSPNRSGMGIPNADK